MKKRRGLAVLPALIAALALAPGRGSRAEDKDLVELENARADYSGEAAGLKLERDSKLKALGERHRQVAERGKAAATKKGDLKLALAWEKLEKELEPEEPKLSGARPGDPDPREVEKARSEYAREAAELEAESRRRLRALREKHRKIADQGKAAATKKGDLKLALGWEALERDLEPKLVNLALKAKLEVNAQVAANAKESMTDGDLTVVHSAQKYWFSGRTAPKPDWATFDLVTPKAIYKVRLLTPVGIAWVRGGHEPLEYELSFKLAGKTREKVSVRGGGHPKKELSKDGQTQWIEIALKAEVDADKVEFRTYKTSGVNMGPVIFEFEILGEE